MATNAPHYPKATAEQVGFYADHRWITVADAIDPGDLTKLSARCDDLIERNRANIGSA